MSSIALHRAVPCDAVHPSALYQVGQLSVSKKVEKVEAGEKNLNDSCVKVDK